MTKYLISGYIGFDNFGDEAIACVLVNHLKETGAEKITVLSKNPQKTADEYGCQSINMLKFVPAIFNSDVLISGGGSLLQDVTSLKSLLYYLSVIFTAIFFWKKVFIFAQGMTPFRTTIGKILTKFTLKRCHKISVRDKTSQILLEEMDINSELVCDPVFGIKIPTNIPHNGIGVQLRSFGNLSEKFLNKLADEIFKQFPNKKINLFSLQDACDMPVINTFTKILSERNMKYEIHKNMTISECVEKITSLEYLIGMRFHACLIASKAGVKVLGINYDIKVQTLAENTGFPYINLTENNIADKIQQLMIVNPEEYQIPTFKFPQFT